MKKYIRERESTARNSNMFGVVLTVLLHAGALALCAVSGLKYLDPPPPDSTFVIDFTQVQEEEEVVKPPKTGRLPRSENPDRTKPIEIVQRSSSPVKTLAKNNTAAEAAPDEKGDVEVPAPEKKINRNALFPGMSKKDTATANGPHSAKDPRAEFRAGHMDGNTTSGKADGTPNAHLQGRSVDKASLTKPSGGTNVEGKVVVDIWVDQYGNVKKAAIDDASTITNSKVLASARAEAMKAHFSTKADAPAMQKGTITYIYKLQ